MSLLENIHISSNVVDVVAICTLNVSGFDKEEEEEELYANTCYKNVTFSEFNCVFTVLFSASRIGKNEI